jgi:hypothetical protein
VRFLPSLALALLLTASATAVELSLNLAAIDQAILIGRSADRERSRFHAPYRLAVGRAPVDHIDIITPFRRVVLGTEHSVGRGDRSFGQRQAFALAAAAPEQIDIRVELTFHPMNAYVGVPGYEVTLATAAGAPIRPKGLDLVPRFGARVDGTPPPSPARPGAGISLGEPVLGGTVIARFDGRLLVAGAVYDVLVAEKGKEVARARLPLSKIR